MGANDLYFVKFYMDQPLTHRVFITPCIVQLKQKIVKLDIDRMKSRAVEVFIVLPILFPHHNALSNCRELSKFISCGNKNLPPVGGGLTFTDYKTIDLIT